MSDTPLVSIIMPVYNGEEFLEESISSVLGQTYKNWELLIIDDASTDGSFEIAERFQNQEERILCKKLSSNQGTGAARNTGIKSAKGNFIAFLDADDLWTPTKIEAQLRFMKEKNAKVSFTSYELINENGESMNLLVRALKELSLQKLMKANYIGNLTGMYNAKEIGKIYSPPLRKRQDWGLWLEAVKRSGKAFGMVESNAQYRVRKNSLSGNKFGMLGYNYNVYRKVLGFSTVKSSVCFLKFLKEQFFVKPLQTEVLDK